MRPIDTFDVRLDLIYAVLRLGRGGSQTRFCHNDVDRMGKSIGFCVIFQITLDGILAPNICGKIASNVDLDEP